MLDFSNVMLQCSISVFVLQAGHRRVLQIVDITEFHFKISRRSAHACRVGACPGVIHP